MTAAAPKPGRVENLRRLNADPAFAAARDDRARAVLDRHREEMSKASAIARRGVDVPPELEEAWRELKAKKISNREAAEMLGLRWAPTVEADRLAADLLAAVKALRAGQVSVEAIRARIAELGRVKARRKSKARSGRGNGTSG
jgi:hypothetical protein